MRIRSIKPEFWRSDDIARLSWDDRLLFIGLWSYVDDNGVGRDEERIISADLFALDDQFSESSLRVHAGLMRLHAANLIERYEVGGRKYLHITTWSKHQKINRPSPGRYPLPTVENSVIHDALTESSLSPHNTLSAGTGEQRNRGTEEQIKNIPVKQVSRSPAYSDDFEVFWKAYPSFRRKEKPKAWAEWRKAVKRATPDRIIDGLREYLTGDVTYAPYPAKWLKTDSWNDGPDTSQRMRSGGIVTRTQRAQAEWDEDRRIRAELESRQQGGGRLALAD